MTIIDNVYYGLGDCPFGKECIDDWGISSNCEVNKKCMYFSSKEQKLEWEIKNPDKHAIIFNDGIVITFKNKNQVDFYLTNRQPNPNNYQLIEIPSYPVT